jgi:hypothetical protein
MTTIREKLRQLHPPHTFRESPLINLYSALSAAQPDINEERLTELIKEGNDIRIAFNHSKCNKEYNDLVTNNVQICACG